MKKGHVVPLFCCMIQVLRSLKALAANTTEIQIEQGARATASASPLRHCAGALVPPVLGGVVVVVPVPVLPVEGGGVALVVPVSAPPLCEPWLLSQAARVKRATVEIEAKISFLIGQLSLTRPGKIRPATPPTWISACGDKMTRF